MRASPAHVADTGLYELVRNWVIGVELAGRLGSSFTLINLGAPSLARTADRFSTPQLTLTGAK